MIKIIKILLVLVVLGCSSTSTTQADDSDFGDGGLAGSTSIGAAGNLGTGGTGVSEGGDESAAGSVSVGGAISAGGVGSSVGGVSAAGGNTCVPKTCAQLVPESNVLSKGSACGITSDGCGGVLSCGPCLTDGTVNTDCGQAPPADEAGDWSGYGLSPTPNVCGTRCVKVARCGEVGIDNWLCPSTIPPIGIANCRIVSTYKTVQSWCCG